MIYRWLTESKEMNAKQSSNSISLADYNRLLRENQALKEIVAEKETVHRCDLKYESKMHF